MNIKMALKSAMLPASGEGYSSLIDTDVVFDNYGLPYFPARRLKGLLRESVLEVLEMTKQAGIKLQIGIGNNSTDKDDAYIEEIFGSGTQAGGVIFHDLRLEENALALPWLKWAFNEFNNLLSADTVLNTMTEIRYQTAVDQEGIAADNSLRTVRVLEPGLVFTGELTIKKEQLFTNPLLALACANLKHAGSKRTRGFGEVYCSLWDGQQDISSSTIKQLKGAG